MCIQAFGFYQTLTDPLEDNNVQLTRTTISSVQQCPRCKLSFYRAFPPYQTHVSTSHVSNQGTLEANTPVKTSPPNLSEILVYCQNFNRMTSFSKMTEIRLNLLSAPFLIILATETGWNECIRSEEVFGNNFNVFRDDRNSQLSQKKSGGGVLVAISSKFNSDIIPTLKHKDFEHVWTKSIINGETHVFASVYFPPNTHKNTYDSFFKIANEIISQLDPEVKVHIYGDFNQREADFISDIENESILLPVVGDNSTLQSIFDEIAGLGLHQINNVKNQQLCYLDFLLTNTSEDFCVTASSTPLWKNEAFHTAIEYSLFVHENTRPIAGEFEVVYEYNKANYNNIRDRLRSVDWQHALRSDGDIDACVDLFYFILSDIIRDEVPSKRKRANIYFKDPPWYHEGIKNLINKKQRAHKSYKTCTDEKKLDRKMTKYIEISDQLNTAINIAFEEYNYKTEHEIKSNPKNFFNYVKTTLKSSTFPSRMHLDEKNGDNPGEICNLFSSFFQEIYTTKSEEERDRDYFSFVHEFPNDVSVSTLNHEEILGALKGLDASKGSGPDSIPPLFLKNLADELTYPLFLLFNCSLESRKFPKIWKKSFLVPIFKSGKKSDVRNYRGIAIISCIPKLFESIVNNKIIIQVKNRITCAQHGFFKGRSTSTNLLEFVNYTLNAMDNGNYVNALYTDFSKAFDRVDIPLLLFKLNKIGVQPCLLEWLKSYLTERQQTVKYLGKLSNPINVTSGVPQGSHLGPLLFILYVNDISFVLKCLKIQIYADDIKLFLEIKSSEDINIFQKEVDLFHTWCVKSLLELNVKKCNSISFSRKHNTPDTIITLGNQSVEKLQKVRDLGVILDSKLNFTYHYNSIIHKASNMLGFIKRFCYNFTDPYTIKTLYISYVRSILEYCSTVWSPYSVTHIERIESVQKQFLLYALRRLGWSGFSLPPYESRCMLINIETLKERRDSAMIYFVNDLISQRIDSTELLSKLNFYVPSRQLRTRSAFLINRQRTNYAKFSPINRMMETYNKHCEMIDFTMSRANLKKYFKSGRSG